MKQVTVYESEDGSLHRTRKGAILQDARVSVENWILGDLYVDGDTCASDISSKVASDIVSWCVDNAEELIPLLNVVVAERAEK